MSKKATKLKDMKLTSVDLVKRGANPDADICLYKSADGTVPTDDRSILRQMFDLLKSAFSTDEDPESIEKDAKSFDNIRTKEESREKLWRYQDALRASIHSILEDDDLEADKKKQQLNLSLEQYSQAMKSLFDDLVDVSSPTIAVAATKSADEGDPAPAGDPETKPNPIEKGDKNMAYDMSKLTDDERATFEKLSKKCKVADTKKSAEGDTTPAAEPATEPTTDPAPADTTPAPAPDVNKSAEVDPVLKSALEEVQALKKSMEMKELAEVAKKYEPIGKKADELAQQLYDLKKSGEGNFNAYIALLDEQLELVNKSGLFTEVGKNTHGPVTKGADDAVSQVEAIAKGYMEADATLDYNTAMTRAWEANPSLLKQYEESYK